MSLTVSSSYGPFPDRDAFQYYSLKCLSLSDIPKVSRVCKRWCQWLNDSNLVLNDLWKAFFKEEGIPLVISTNGTARNYKQDFKTLYPITFSGKTISQFFGKVTEKIPPISEKQYNELKEPDPFEKGKLKGETFVFIVDPSFVMRTIDKETPLALGYNGDLKSPKESQRNPETNTIGKSELKIPLSLKNITVLCSYPLKGKENMPVFNQKSMGYVHDYPNKISDKISIYFMRRHVVDESRDMPYDQQKKLIEDQGFEVPSLRVRAFFNATHILKEGTCPDARRPRYTLSRHPEINYGYDGNHHVVVGGFAPGIGVSIDYSRTDYAGIGVVPGRPAV